MEKLQRVWTRLEADQGMDLDHGKGHHVKGHCVTGHHGKGYHSKGHCGTGLSQEPASSFVNEYREEILAGI